MNRSINYIVSLFMFVAYGHLCAAGPISDLAAFAVPGEKPILKGVPHMEVIVVSECNNENVALNPNINFKTVDMTVTKRTAYVQEPDGSRGMRIIFDRQGYNDLQRYDVIVLDVNGGRLDINKSTGSITVKGLSPLAVISRKSGSVENVPVKEKLISELTDEDIFTMVTLKDMEFAFKDGAIVNIKENYGQYV